MFNNFYIIRARLATFTFSLRGRKIDEITAGRSSFSFPPSHYLILYIVLPFLGPGNVPHMRV